MGLRRSRIETPAPERPGLYVLRAARIRPGLRLTFLLLLSVALHVGAAAVLYDRPLGRLEGLDQHRSERVLRVRETQYADPLGADQGQAATEPEQNGPSTAELSDNLLREITPAEATAPEAPPPAERETRHERTEPEREAEDDSATDELLASMVEQSPRDVTFSEGPAMEQTTGGDGTQTEDGGGAPRAGELLARAGEGSEPGPGIGTGSTGSGVSADTTAIERRPRLESSGGEVGSTSDRRRMPMDLGRQSLDFAEQALAGTTELQIPRHLDNDFSYYLSRYDADDEPGYFRVDIAARASLQKLPAMAKDVIFLVDTSDSISSDWVNAVMAGVKQSLPSLNDADRFNIVLFDEEPRFFSTEGLKPAEPQALQQARRFLDQGHSGGYTDINSALRQLLVRRVQPERVRQIVLLSDGQPTQGVMDTRELINLITRENNRASSIYCVGIGDEQNRELLDFLAYRNTGFSRYIRSANRASQRIADLMSRLRYPLIKDVRLDVVGVDGQTVYPRRLPNIHDQQQISAFGRYDEPKSFTVRITGQNSGQTVDFTFTRDLSLASEGDPTIEENWAFWKLHHLYSEILRRGENSIVRRQIEQLRREYDLETVY